MDATRRQDRISILPDMILVIIISNLSLKEATRTCTLNKRWKNVHRQNTNVVFNESELVKSSVSDDEDTRMAKRFNFVCFMLDWISKFCGEGIETFQLCFSKPVGYATEIKSLLEFAVSKGVKNLIVDFSDPSWTTSNQAREGRVFTLPECVYNQTKLESLKLIACEFNPLKLAGSLKSLWFGWIEVGNIVTNLLSYSPLMESLTLQNCWNVGLDAITRYNNKLRELIIENCEFSCPNTNLDLPNLEIFRYIGRVHCFRFMGVNNRVREAYLDYGLETEDDRSKTTLLSDLLNDLSMVKKLTICPYLIQLIQHQEEGRNQLQAPMETKHLVLKTSITFNELYGIRLLMNSCPLLETLTLVMVPYQRTVALVTTMNFDPNTFWEDEANIYPCFEEKLKLVNFKNFRGIPTETKLLKHLIRNGQELERIELFLPRGHDAWLYNWVTDLVEEIGNSSIAASTQLWMFTNSG